jgi:2-polyprenyl-3-methyl-5-hydroxy-6-metoxy-1,4-benzoquinol methylase
MSRQDGEMKFDTRTLAVSNEARAFAVPGEWPTSDLEVRGECPVCGNKRRSLMFSGLRDFAFAAAPGEWNMWQCQSCTAAYLDPRPTLASISRAYSRYYTHQFDAVVDLKIGPLRALRQWLGTRLMNDYINRTYGHRLPAAPMGAVISGLWLTRRRRTDHLLRHLPAPKSAGSALLDVGCGNGEFLKLATRLGFRAVGVEADEKVVTFARSAGLDVRIGHFPRSGLAPNSFEHVTARHVIEHLHDPKETIRELHGLLQQGGRLWLSQPNLGAIGLKTFGPYWRGLEPPRHLTLFDVDGMRSLLESCGFVKVTLLPPEPVAGFYYRQSLCQASGVDPYEKGDPPTWSDEWDQRAKDADDRAKADPRLGESLSMIAWKQQD